jgi:hypothetical protein
LWNAHRIRASGESEGSPKLAVALIKFVGQYRSAIETFSLSHNMLNPAHSDKIAKIRGKLYKAEHDLARFVFVEGGKSSISVPDLSELKSIEKEMGKLWERLNNLIPA